MKIIRKIKSMQKLSDALRAEGKTIGFVPTMGAFHDGHLSLMQRSVKDCDATVVSIFVNKLQFGPTEDFNKYPRQLEKDRKMAETVGVDYIFAPEHDEFYSDSFSSFVKVYGVTENLCGASRPGHFIGVLTVVTKLFHAVKPHKAFFGEKDFQQLVVIKKMVKELNFDIEIVGSKIFREKNGLAMSSRNEYLSADERNKATIIYSCLKDAKRLFHSGEKSSLKIIKNAVNLINAQGFEVDYVKIVDMDTLKDVKKIETVALMAVAVKVGRTRLIDNIVLK